MYVHKRSVYIAEMEDNGDVKEQYEILNDESACTGLGERYICMKPEISLEVSTSGKYAARKLRDMGFSIHLADPSKLPLIFNTARKNDREDSYMMCSLYHLDSYKREYIELMRYKEESRGGFANLLHHPHGTGDAHA